MRALILDCDGVLAETEREFHLPAFNQAFAEFGLALRWTSDEYGARLRIAGGRERLASALTGEHLAALGRADTAGERRALAEQVHRRKTQIVAEMLTRQPPRPRPGVRRLTAAAHAAGWRLAVASTSADAAVRRVVAAVLGEALAAHVLVLAGDVVAVKKPDPEIYELALMRLGAAPAEAVVVEDSANGLAAASAAGLTCVVTVSEYTRLDDFGAAKLVLSSLGDPECPMSILANRSRLIPDGQLTVDDLEALVASADGR